MTTSAQTVPSAPTAAVAPRGVNHLVLNVRDIEVSHKFWTEIMGFKCVAELKNRPWKMRFYSGVDDRGGSPITTWPSPKSRPGRARTRRASGSCSPARWASTTWR